MSIRVSARLTEIIKGFPTVSCLCSRDICIISHFQKKVLHDCIKMVELLFDSLKYTFCILFQAELCLDIEYILLLELII